MKTLLKQKGTKHDTREEVIDSLAGMQSGPGCVFAYADFTEMRAIGFFEMNTTHSIVPTPTALVEDSSKAPKWRGQDWVVVLDDSLPGPDEEDRIKVKIHTGEETQPTQEQQEEAFFNYLTNR